MDQAQSLRNVIKKQNQGSARNSARVITVTSGKGGVGKSNLSVNLAIQFCKMGKKVIIFDADFGLANVEIMFGVRPRYTLSDLIYHEKEINEIITKGPIGVGFVSGGSGVLSLNNLLKEQIVYLIKCLDQLCAMTDILIVDTGAGISDSVLEFVVASPEILLVTTPDPSSLTDSYSLLKALFNRVDYNRNKNRVHVVSNRVVSNSEGKAVYDKLKSVVEQFLEGEIHYLGMIPHDNALEKAVRQQKPVSLCYPNAKSSDAFGKLAEALIYRRDNDMVHTKWGITKLIHKFVNR